MVVQLSVGDQIRQSHIIFKIINDYQAYIISMDEGYDAGDSFVNGYI